MKIKVGTSSEEAKLKFIRALEESKEFSDVQLVSDHAALTGDPADKETLELNVVYSRT